MKHAQNYPDRSYLNTLIDRDAAVLQQSELLAGTEYHYNGDGEFVWTGLAAIDSEVFDTEMYHCMASADAFLCRTSWTDWRAKHAGKKAEAKRAKKIAWNARKTEYLRACKELDEALDIDDYESIDEVDRDIEFLRKRAKEQAKRQKEEREARFANEKKREQERHEFEQRQLQAREMERLLQASNALTINDRQRRAEALAREFERVIDLPKVARLAWLLLREPTEFELEFFDIAYSFSEICLRYSVPGGTSGLPINHLISFDASRYIFHNQREFLAYLFSKLECKITYLKRLKGGGLSSKMPRSFKVGFMESRSLELIISDIETFKSNQINYYVPVSLWNVATMYSATGGNLGFAREIVSDGHQYHTQFEFHYNAVPGSIPEYCNWTNEFIAATSKK